MAPLISHPLEPLTADEVRLAVTLLKDNRKVTPTTRFVSVSLHEPPKEAVRSFSKQSPPPREAFAVLFDNGTNMCHEAVLSLTDRKLVSWTHIPDVQPTSLSYPRWKSFNLGGAKLLAGAADAGARLRPVR